jgi:hypothetical protein
MRHSLRPAHALLVPAVVLAIAAACGSPSSPASTDPVAAAPAATGATATTVKTVPVPSDACGWIAAAEVEQVIGKLEGPPRAVGNDCVYPLAEKSKAFASLIEMRRRLGESGNPAADRDLRDEVRVSVDSDGQSNAIEIASAAMGKIFAKELGADAGTVATKAPPPGWDAESGLPYTWIGRRGHVSIVVFSPPEISKDKKMALAAKVRDAIPDLPFAAENTYQVISLGGGNPCDLLPRAEAEAVLGTLVVDPYRAIEYTPKAYEKGKACAYYTPGHRAFVVTAEWQDGAMTYNLSRGLGALIGGVVPLEKGAFQGPWDQGRVDGTSGALIFLKGEGFLRVDYLNSAADRDGALALAAKAMARLAAS